MKVEFFAFREKHKEPIKNANAMIRFGIIFMFIGFLIFLMTSFGIFSPVGNNTAAAEGFWFKAIIEFMQLTVFKWLIVTLFSIVGIYFAMKGVSEKRKISEF